MIGAPRARDAGEIPATASAAVGPDPTDPVSFQGADPTFLNHHAWSLRWIDRRRSVDMAEAVLQHSRSAGPERVKGARRRNGLALRTLSWQARWRGSFDEAEDLAHRALARLRGEGAESAIADTFCVLAAIHTFRGRRDIARDYVERGFGALSKQDNLATRVDLLVAQAIVELFAGRIDVAQKAMQAAEKLAEGPQMAQVEHCIARALSYDDRPGEALEYGFRALELAKEHGNRVILPITYEIVAASLIDLDRLDQGEMFLNTGMAMALEDGDRRAEVQLQFQLLRVCLQKGSSHKALELAQNGVDLTDKIGHHLWHVRFLKKLAALQEDLGQTEAALQSLKSLLAIRETEQG